MLKSNPHLTRKFRQQRPAKRRGLFMSGQDQSQRPSPKTGLVLVQVRRPEPMAWGWFECVENGLKTGPKPRAPLPNPSENFLSISPQKGMGFFLAHRYRPTQNECDAFTGREHAGDLYRYEYAIRHLLILSCFCMCGVLGIRHCERRMTWRTVRVARNARCSHPPPTLSGVNSLDRYLSRSLSLSVATPSLRRPL